MQNKTIVINPCPYCGGKAYIDFVFNMPYINAFHTKKCKMCPNTWLIASNLSLKKQIKAWNMRFEKDEE